MHRFHFIRWDNTEAAPQILRGLAPPRRVVPEDVSDTYAFFHDDQKLFSQDLTGYFSAIVDSAIAREPPEYDLVKYVTESILPYHSVIRDSVGSVVNVHHQCSLLMSKKIKAELPDADEDPDEAEERLQEVYDLQCHYECAARCILHAIYTITEDIDRAVLLMRKKIKKEAAVMRRRGESRARIAEYTGGLENAVDYMEDYIDDTYSVVLQNIWDYLNDYVNCQGREQPAGDPECWDEADKKLFRARHWVRRAESVVYPS